MKSQADTGGMKYEVVRVLGSVLLALVMACGRATQLTRKRIAFGADRDFDNEIYVMNTDGPRQARLTNSYAEENSLAWSP